jgi:hypothetical protein
MKIFLCLLCLFYTSLSGLEPLNEIQYKFSTEQWSFFNRDTVSHITQEQNLVGVVEGEWSKTRKSNCPAYLLKDVENNVVAQAWAYRREKFPDNLFFDITDVSGELLATLSVDYNVRLNMIKLANHAILYSADGTPVLEDEITRYTDYTRVYIPGTKQLALELNPKFNRVSEVQIHNIPYLADMKIPTSVILLYLGIRRDRYDYVYAHAKNVYPIYYE